MREHIPSGMTGEELRAIRHRLKMTQKQFAKALGRHYITISDWERGKKPIPKSIAIAAKALR
jgi:DNA-binding transcriptional regulator YiaG